MFRPANLLIPLLLLTACATPRPIINQPPLVIGTTYVQRATAPALNEPLTIIVVTKDNVQDIIARHPILISMTPEQFEQLVENNQKVLVFIANQNKVIELYEKQAKPK